jgi:hydrogenase maturation protein HypF
LVDDTGDTVAEGEAALPAARSALLEGKIVALKALGGFQLACRADRDATVAQLRARKLRPTKPFAVMVRDLETVSSVAAINELDASLMRSPRCPVVLAPKSSTYGLSESVAPGLEDLGVMLPTTPLHVELLRDDEMPPLVMTSANLSEEPICRSNREAVDRLSGIADLYLLHDRDVVRRVDDSVVRSSPSGPIMVRRSRGWVPEALPLPVPAPEPILAVGGHLLVTACLATGDQAFVSQHIGDLDSERARMFHTEVIDGLEDFLEVEPTIVVADGHPDYPSSWMAESIASKRDGRLLQVQHHVAHAAAVLAEHARFPEPGASVLAVSLDGTGWGPDGTSWGGEWLCLDGDLAWSRLAHLEPLPLVGGERAVREPWRIAAAALAAVSEEDLLVASPVGLHVEPERLQEAARLAGSGSWPMTTGAGRLFEACGALLGLTVANDWEGEAAVRLESLAATAGPGEVWDEVELVTGDGVPLLPTAVLLAAAARRIVDGEPADHVAASFHTTFCSLAVSLLTDVAPEEGMTVALGGGCMINRRLIDGLGDGLRDAGFQPLLARDVPPGDGGLAYGQASVAAVALARECEVRQRDSNDD